MKGRLLVVEDDHALNEMLALEFRDRGFGVEQARTLSEARAEISSAPPDVVLLDQHLPDGLGMSLLETIVTQEPELAVVMMTGAHDLELAIRAIKEGAYDFVHKPVQLEELLHVVAKAIHERSLARRVRAHRSDAQVPATLGEMIGQCRAMLAVSKEIALVAGSDARVLITGESGTGKELVARAIHNHSGREGSFLAVNCAAIVDTLLESELFGHEKGAFTGAVSRKAGKFELAADGTLFLDEVGELALSLQAKLLRVLQEGVFQRVGGTANLSASARVIAATNRDLAAEVGAGRFREDLLYRLNVIHIPMPPLRERSEDVPLLVEALMQRLSAKLHQPALRVSDSAMHALIAHDWPGNVRELENVLTQAIVRARGTLLTPDMLSLHGGAESAPGPGADDSTWLDRSGAPLSLDAIEAQHIQRVLDYTGGHKGQSCELLGISRPALDRKIKKYGLVVQA